MEIDVNELLQMIGELTVQNRLLMKQLQALADVGEPEEKTDVTG